MKLTYAVTVSAVWLTATALVACGGTTINPGPQRDAGTQSDASSSVDANPICAEQNQRARGFCSLTQAKPQTPLTLTLRQNCAGARGVNERCVAAVNGTTITVKMLRTTCASDAPEPEVCRVADVVCTLPPLAVNTYKVVVDQTTTAGDAFTPGPEAPMGTLVVTDNGTQTSCSLPPLGTPPPVIATASYDNTCAVDADCTLVDTKVCTPCCPTEAISKASAEKFYVDLANKAATCTRGEPTPVCSCAPSTVICGLDKKCAVLQP